jgi:hypothetical protein
MFACRLVLQFFFGQFNDDFAQPLNLRSGLVANNAVGSLIPQSFYDVAHHFFTA